jgi:hypothetical protein
MATEIAARPSAIFLCAARRTRGRLNAYQAKEEARRLRIRVLISKAVHAGLLCARFAIDVGLCAHLTHFR